MIQKQFKTMKLTDLIPYENNPRINDDAVKDVIASIKQCENLDPIEIDENNVILSGHTRHKALTQLAYEETEVIQITGLTDEQKRKYRLLANKTGERAEWDLSKLEVELDGLDFEGYDFEFDGIDIESVSSDSNDVENISLNNRFVVPPFSVLDTRQGYWQDRKKQWIEQGIESNKGRSQNLTSAIDKSDYMKTGCKGVAVQTSVFDPVLCEIMYKWFNTNGGAIYDCFSGGSVRGIIAEMLGYKYFGIDLRQEQVDENIKHAQQIGVSPTWYCDDSLNADKYIDDNSVDMLFTCPPYADLEVYSDDKRDISNMDYDDFCKVYADILSIACKKLKNDRFAVVVIGDVRDKQGAYRQLVDYTRKVLTDNGLCLYNDFVLVESVGTGAIRAPKQFNSLRKAVKTHQNVLCFYKGNIKNIKNNYPELDFSEDELQ